MYDRYIPVDESLDVLISDFILRGKPKIRHDGVLAQHAGRSGDIVPFTLMGKIAATGKLQTYVNAAAGDGTAIPQVIYIGPTILEADIQAGDVEGLIVLERDAEFDESLLVIENSLTLDTVITVGTTDLRTVRDYLMNLNLIPRTVETRTDYA